MRTVLEKSPLHKDKSGFFDQIISEYAALNATRNKYVHGLWYTLEDEPRVFLEEETDNYRAFLEKREVPYAEITGTLHRMIALISKLLEREHTVFVARELLKSQQSLGQPSADSSGKSQKTK